MKPVRQRLVRTHPVTGRKSLYLSSHAGTIIGWPVPEARDFLRDLNEHATQRELVYIHRWRQYDLVMWDNRQTMHRVRRFDETPAARHAPHHGRGRGDDGRAGRGGVAAKWNRFVGDASEALRRAGWLRSVSSTHFSTSFSRSSMLFARRSFSYFIQHWPFASSGVSAACCSGRAAARRVRLLARPAGAGREGAAVLDGSLRCGSTAVAQRGARSEELVPPAQPASERKGAAAMSCAKSWTSRSSGLHSAAARRHRACLTGCRIASSLRSIALFACCRAARARSRSSSRRTPPAR